MKIPAIQYMALLTVLASLGCNFTKVNQTVTLNETTPVNAGAATSGSTANEATKMEALGSMPPKEFNGAFTDATKIRSIMEFLASDALEGRDTGSAGIEQAANFIENGFKENGLRPYFSGYKDTLTNMADVTAFNVVGYLEGQDENLKKEFVIIGAHYDHIGLIAEEAGDAIANGANDNATGTTTVMELARYFGSKNNNKRSILFTLFTAEEKGLLGSQHLAQRLQEKGLDLYVMLNFEMVGVPMQDRDYLLYLTGYENSNLAEVSNAYAKSKFAGFLPKAKEFNLFKRSDNYPFHEQFNVPSQTYSTFDFTNYDYYHKVDDEVFEMDFEHMANVVNRAIPVMEGIINAPVREVNYN